MQTEDVVLVYSGTSLHPAVAPADTLRLVVENNAQPSALMTIYLEYALGY